MSQWLSDLLCEYFLNIELKACLIQTNDKIFGRKQNQEWNIDRGREKKWKNRRTKIYREVEQRLKEGKSKDWKRGRAKIERGGEQWSGGGFGEILWPGAEPGAAEGRREWHLLSRFPPITQSAPHNYTSPSSCSSTHSGTTMNYNCNETRRHCRWFHSCHNTRPPRNHCYQSEVIFSKEKKTWKTPTDSIGCCF